MRLLIGSSCASLSVREQASKSYIFQNHLVVLALINEEDRALGAHQLSTSEGHVFVQKNLAIEPMVQNLVCCQVSDNIVAFCIILAIAN